LPIWPSRTASDTTGFLMGQLRTANKRRNRALRVTPTVNKDAPKKVVRKSDSAPVKKTV
jgi:hypothetical protein